MGFIACAGLAGWIMDRFGRAVIPTAAGLLAGTAVVYFLGTLWYILVTKVGAGAALSVCVLPFLPGDALKIIFCTVLIPRAYPLLKNQK
jgi:biotin transport system substrate-specific component